MANNKEMRVVKGLDVERATYTLKEDKATVHVLNETWSGGKRDSIEGIAYKADPKSDEAKLKVKFYVPPFLPIIPVVGNYWFHVDPDYQVALILARKTHIDDEIYNLVVEKAKEEGYDVTKLHKTPQSDPPPEEKDPMTTRASKKDKKAPRIKRNIQTHLHFLIKKKEKQSKKEENIEKKLLSLSQFSETLKWRTKKWRWYEIASFPSRNQPKNGVDTRATYTLNEDGTVHVLNETWSDGKRGSIEGTAYKVDPNSDEAKLKVKFYVPPFLPIIPVTGDYWVLYIDEDTKSLSCQPSRNYLWILSRKSQIDDEIFNELVERAKSEGYDVSKLHKTPHSSPPEGRKAPRTPKAFDGIGIVLKERNHFYNGKCLITKRNEYNIKNSLSHSLKASKTPSNGEQRNGSSKGSGHKEVHGKVATYTLNEDGTVHVLNETWSDGKRDSIEGTAYKANPNSDEAKLKVKFYVPPFLPIIPVTGDYWVLFIDEDYQVALVGQPTRKYLWILARRTHIDDEIYNQLVEKAKEEGYDVTKLHKTPQSDPPPEGEEGPKDTKGIWWIKSLFGK
ncbi:hypothetical protein G4B88_007844 [Cannabis sativa]|uniref:Lipocalin/cytosolic fatty-acid binding domain-containing protein n=1 Tax=Cannabis sativa TaxID=3483 RepID=A0A7J6DT36_CANSA|nr:hypothetical protein G4B88_007844 [Cannabis sativa]